jgi:hypothetical protein
MNVLVRHLGAVEPLAEKTREKGLARTICSWRQEAQHAVTACPLFLAAPAPSMASDTTGPSAPDAADGPA